MKVIGIDPGYGRVGWAVLEGNRSKQVLIDCGCTETKAGQALELRLEKIYDFLDNLVTEYGPDEVAVEEIYFFKNQKTVMQVGQARGAIVLTFQIRKVPIFHYTPLQVKQCVTGYGRADKNQVQTMVKSILGLKEVPEPDDAADAVAIALTHFMFNRQLLA